MGSIHHFLRQVLPLAWVSLLRLDWLANDPSDHSISVSLVLGSQEHTNTIDFLTQVLLIELGSSCLCSGTLLSDLCTVFLIWDFCCCEETP